MNTIELEPEQQEAQNNPQENSALNLFLAFQVNRELYGIDISYVIEIVSMQTITAVPNMPLYVKGVINLRGKVIPVIDMRLKFNLPAVDYNDRTCAVVVQIDDCEIGLIVDSVDDVLDIPKEDVTPPPHLVSSSAGSYLYGIGRLDQKIVMLLNIETFIEQQDLVQISSANFKQPDLGQ